MKYVEHTTLKGVQEDVRFCVERLKRLPTPGRALSVAITNLETGLLWLESHIDQAEVEDADI